MGSLSKPRYCSLGEQCTQYSSLGGSPAKLSRYNTQTICEACRRAGAGQAERQPTLHTEEESLEQFRNRLRSEGKEVLHSDVERKLVAIKQELVEQLWLQRGPFWEAVRDMRARCGIIAVTASPATIGAPGPPECAPKAPEEGGEEAEWDAFGERWSADLFSIRDRTVPRYFHEGVDWWDFLNSCVLYDPPVPGLHEFARRGGIMFSSGVPERPSERHGLPRMARPPIKLLRDPEELEALEAWRWFRLMQELQERYLKPLGLNVWEMLDDIERNPPPGLVEEYFKRLDQLDDGRRVYIEVDEQTTKEDIEKASQIARAWQKNRPPRSRPLRNRLTCIECAVLKDQHDWSNEQVAERFDWEHIEKVRKHAEVGRAIIEGE